MAVAVAVLAVRNWRRKWHDGAARRLLVAALLVAVAYTLTVANTHAVDAATFALPPEDDWQPVPTTDWQDVDEPLYEDVELNVAEIRTSLGTLDTDLLWTVPADALAAGDEYMVVNVHRTEPLGGALDAALSACAYPTVLLGTCGGTSSCSFIVAPADMVAGEYVLSVSDPGGVGFKFRFEARMHRVANVPALPAVVVGSGDDAAKVQMLWNDASSMPTRVFTYTNTYGNTDLSLAFPSAPTNVDVYASYAFPSLNLAGAAYDAVGGSSVPVKLLNCYNIPDVPLYIVVDNPNPTNTTVKPEITNMNWGEPAAPASGEMDVFVVHNTTRLTYAIDTAALKTDGNAYVRVQLTAKASNGGTNEMVATVRPAWKSTWGADADALAAQWPDTCSDETLMWYADGLDYAAEWHVYDCGIGHDLDVVWLSIEHADPVNGKPLVGSIKVTYDDVPLHRVNPDASGVACDNTDAACASFIASVSKHDWAVFELTSSASAPVNPAVSLDIVLSGVKTTYYILYRGAPNSCAASVTASIQSYSVTHELADFAPQPNAAGKLYARVSTDTAEFLQFAASEYKWPRTDVLLDGGAVHFQLDPAKEREYAWFNVQLPEGTDAYKIAINATEPSAADLSLFYDGTSLAASDVLAKPLTEGAVLSRSACFPTVTQTVQAKVALTGALAPANFTLEVHSTAAINRYDLDVGDAYVLSLAIVAASDSNPVPLRYAAQNDEALPLLFQFTLAPYELAPLHSTGDSGGRFDWQGGGSYACIEDVDVFKLANSAFMSYFADEAEYTVASCVNDTFCEVAVFPPTRSDTYAWTNMVAELTEGTSVNATLPAILSVAAASESADESSACAPLPSDFLCADVAPEGGVFTYGDARHMQHQNELSEYWHEYLSYTYSDGLESDAEGECAAALLAYACSYAFGRCESRRVGTEPCRTACEAAEDACGATTCADSCSLHPDADDYACIDFGYVGDIVFMWLDFERDEWDSAGNDAALKLQLRDLYDLDGTYGIALVRKEVFDDESRRRGVSSTSRTLLASAGHLAGSLMLMVEVHGAPSDYFEALLKAIEDGDFDDFRVLAIGVTDSTDDAIVPGGGGNGGGANVGAIVGTVFGVLFVIGAVVAIAFFVKKRGGVNVNLGAVKEWRKRRSASSINNPMHAKSTEMGQFNDVASVSSLGGVSSAHSSLNAHGPYDAQAEAARAYSGGGARPHQPSFSHAPQQMYAPLPGEETSPARPNVGFGAPQPPRQFGEQPMGISHQPLRSPPQKPSPAVRGNAGQDPFAQQGGRAPPPSSPGQFGRPLGRPAPPLRAAGAQQRPFGQSAPAVRPSPALPAPVPKAAGYGWEINYDELDMQRELGRGAFGIVYRARWRNSDVAVKQLLNELSAEELKSFKAEAELMRNLRPHQNVVLFLGVCLDSRRPLCIVTEYLDHGSLDTLLKSEEQIDMVFVMRLARDIAAGLLHLHSESIIHRDLAARNVLLSAQYDAKIADFGMSRAVAIDEGKTKAETGPLKWMAPESLVSKEYSVQSDVWAFGVTIVEVLCRDDPWAGQDPVQVAIAVSTQGVTPVIPDYCPQLLAQLLRRCFAYEKRDRPDFVWVRKELNRITEALDLYDYQY